MKQFYETTYSQREFLSPLVRKIDCQTGSRIKQHTTNYMNIPKWLIIILTVLILFTGFAYYVLFVPTHYQTHYSPDKEYKLIIYAKPKWFSMPGDGNTKCIKVKLYKGFRQIKNNCDDCPAFTSSVDVSWHMPEKTVLFARGRGLSLETGHCE